MSTSLQKFTTVAELTSSPVASRQGLGCPLIGSATVRIGPSATQSAPSVHQDGALSFFTPAVRDSRESVTSEPAFPESGAIVTICAWCGPKATGPGVSHGICKACSAKMRAEMEEQLEASR